MALMALVHLEAAASGKGTLGILLQTQTDLRVVFEHERNNYLQHVEFIQVLIIVYYIVMYY